MSEPEMAGDETIGSAAQGKAAAAEPTAGIAEWLAAARWEDLPASVVHAATRFVIDFAGVAIAGVGQLVADTGRGRRRMGGRPGPLHGFRHGAQDECAAGRLGQRSERPRPRTGRHPSRGDAASGRRGHPRRAGGRRAGELIGPGPDPCGGARLRVDDPARQMPFRPLAPARISHDRHLRAASPRPRPRATRGTWTPAAWCRRWVWGRASPPGLEPSGSNGAWSKRLHPGHAAQAGVVSATLAARGYRGPSETLLNPEGWARAFAYRDEIDEGMLSSGFGS